MAEGGDDDVKENCSSPLPREVDIASKETSERAPSQLTAYPLNAEQ